MEAARIPISGQTATNGGRLNSIHDPICPRLPPCVYAREIHSKGRKPVFHVFRTIRQRDGWVDMDKGRREPVKPTEKGISKLWERLDLVLHAVDTVPLGL